MRPLKRQNRHTHTQPHVLVCARASMSCNQLQVAFPDKTRMTELYYILVLTFILFWTSYVEVMPVRLSSISDLTSEPKPLGRNFHQKLFVTSDVQPYSAVYTKERFVSVKHIVITQLHVIIPTACPALTRCRNISWGGVRLSPIGASATIWLIVPAPNDIWWVWSSLRYKNWQRTPKCSEITCPSTTLCSRSPTWPGIKPGPPRWEVGD
jgi:hypothetical protein